MTAKKRTLLLAALTGGIALVACAIVGAGASHALSPCRPFEVVRLTGTLIEVRQGGAVVPNEQAILDGVPRSACLSPTYTNQQTAAVTVADCDFAEFFVNATLAP
jgi:hypothetical protein